MSQLSDSLKQTLQKQEREHQAYIADLCAECGRTLEWIETSLVYKNDHPKCEMCGETSDIEAHDILQYSRLTEGQRHDRDFLGQNLISLCHKHHHVVAHRGDPDWIKFNPRIREIAERRLRHKYGRW